MTSMPAAHFGLWDRGLLRAGYAADVVVFDYDELDDAPTTIHTTMRAASSTCSSTGRSPSTAASTPARGRAGTWLRS